MSCVVVVSIESMDSPSANQKDQEISRDIKGYPQGISGIPRIRIFSKAIDATEVLALDWFFIFLDLTMANVQEDTDAVLLPWLQS